MKFLLKLILGLIALPIVGIALLSLLLITLAFIPLPEGDVYGKTTSPDGKYYAVARKDSLSQLIPMMPGGSGDAPGTLTVYSKDGQEVGELSLEMVQQVHSVRWSAEEVYLLSGRSIKLPK